MFAILHIIEHYHTILLSFIIIILKLWCIHSAWVRPSIVFPISSTFCFCYIPLILSWTFVIISDVSPSSALVGNICTLQFRVRLIRSWRISVKSFSRKFSWNWFHGKRYGLGTWPYVRWVICTVRVRNQTLVLVM